MDHNSCIQGLFGKGDQHNNIITTKYSNYQVHNFIVSRVHNIFLHYNLFNRYMDNNYHNSKTLFYFFFGVFFLFNFFILFVCLI